jgi:hypothetical protein
VPSSDGRWLVGVALSTFLTYLGAGGFGLAGALVLDYFGVFGAREDTGPGELVLAMVIFLVAGGLFRTGRRIQARD